jgi:Zn-dependent protease with chaperone function
MDGTLEEWRDSIDRETDALDDLHGVKLLANAIKASEDELGRRFTAARLAAYSVSLLIIGMGPLVLWAGFTLIIRGWPHVVFVAAGLVLVGAAWLLRPQVGSVPADCLQRSEFPNLFTMIDGIAGQLEIKPIHHVRIAPYFNTSMTEAGLAQTPILTIGLPLWTSLSAQERVALIGHELALLANRDPARSPLIRCTLATLDWWLHLLHPTRSEMNSLANIATRLLLRPFGLIISELRHTLVRLLFIDSQRAEYLADHLTAKIAGPVAVVKLLEKIGLRVDRRAAAGHAHFAGDVGSRDNASHPPMASRIRFIKSRQFLLPIVILSDSLSQIIDRELEPFRERFAVPLMDDTAKKSTP